MGLTVLRIKNVVLMLLAMSLLTASAAAKESADSISHKQSAEEVQLGKKLVHQLWSDMKQEDISAIKEIIADSFQSVHNDGARDRQEEIRFISGLDIDEYMLDNFQVTREGPVLVVTYTAAIQETINAQYLSTKPAVRMSVFLKTESGWKWITHSNFKGSKYKEAGELIAFVKNAAALIAQKGENFFDSLRKKGGKWFHGDRYIFVWDMEGMRYVYPPDPQGEGKNMAHLKDIDNKPIGELIIKVASSKEGSGWIHYRWPKPGQIQPSWKSTYLTKVKTPSGKEYIVGSGAYDMRVQKEFITHAVDAAVQLIEHEGKSAFETLRDKRNQFIFQDTYVFVIAENGTELLNPAFPKLEGRNLYDIRDANGKYLVHEFVNLVRSKGKGWVEYMWPKPGDIEPSHKSTYIRKAVIDGKMVIVGAGLYQD